MHTVSTVSIVGAVSAQSAGIRRNIPERGTNTLSRGNGRLESGLVTGTRGGNEGWRINATRYAEEGNPGNAFANQSSPPAGVRISSKEPSVFPLGLPFFFSSPSFAFVWSLDSRAPSFRPLGRAIPSSALSYVYQKEEKRVGNRGGENAVTREKLLRYASSVLARRDTTCKVGHV